MTDLPSTGRSAIRIEFHPPVAWVILDNAEQGNPVDQKFVDEISAAWTELAGHSALGAIGLRSTGPSFSVGTQPVGGNLDGSIGPKSCHNLLPVLVELQGDIAAGAFELLGQADVILSASDVLLTVPADPTSRLDVQHLRPRLPEPELRRLALLGAAEPMTAERAAQLGLIDVVVPKRELRDRATRALMQLAVNSRRGS